MTGGLHGPAVRGGASAVTGQEQVKHKIVGYGHGRSTARPAFTSPLAPGWPPAQDDNDLVVTAQMRTDLERARREAASAIGPVPGAAAAASIRTVTAELEAAGGGLTSAEPQ